MKISGSQMLWIMVCLSITNYLAIGPAIIKGRQDAWIVIGLAGIVAVCITIVTARASLLFADTSIIRYSQALFGKWLGGCIVLPYLVTWFLIMVRDLRDWADYVYLSLLPDTPMVVAVALLVAPVTYVTLRGGITAIGRLGEVSGPVLMLVLFVPLFVMPQALDWRHLQPIYVETGWKNIVQGVIPVTANLCEPAMTLLLLTPFMAEPQHTSSRAWWGIGIMSLWVLLATIVAILFIGPFAPMVRNPWLHYLRSINILNFIQNFDALSAFVWTFVWTVAISTPLFLTGYGIAQWWKINSWRTVTVCVMAVAFVCVIVTRPISLISTTMRETIFVPWIFPINSIGIPLVLWIAGSLKNRRVL